MPFWSQKACSALPSSVAGGSPYQDSRAIRYQLRAMLHVQAAKVTEAGDTMLDEEGFACLGPKLKLRNRSVVYAQAHV